VPDRPDPVDLLRSMLLIRKFEEALAFQPDRGFQLLSSGEEAVAVGVCAALDDRDQLLSSGRSIGPALARGIEPHLVMAELLGKISGPNRGKGGRGHLASPDDGFFGAHAVVGGNLSIAAGVALAAQLEGRGAVVACIFGDGACGAGALHETLNIAALWKLPLIFVCDNNGFSISTPVARGVAAERLSDLAIPFGIPRRTVDGMDVFAVYEAAREFADVARRGDGPGFLECRSERFASHSTSTRETRSNEELAAARERCPILHLGARLEADGTLDAAGRSALEKDVEELVSRAIRFSGEAPRPSPDDALSDVV